MIDPNELERLSKAAVKTEDDIRYYSGGSKYNEPLEQLKDQLVHLYRTSQLVPVQQPSGDVVEAENAKLRGLLQSALNDFRYRVGTIKSPFHWANVAETTLARLDAARGRP